ncbi:glycosyltransferase [Acidiferrimicrobium sp. IK]|uniref:glycosyltransferase n=1 Tax=Acidiferrimicrobium sp. IK TaxID=2871700 RepID=UPI0021CAEB9F|nr:glycosyltransferase [Acidiferrimicrobium sp. IK]MCU4185565.1 glycosyltransferase [Acidiferrimicrobium sp. IK]
MTLSELAADAPAVALVFVPSTGYGDAAERFVGSIRSIQGMGIPLVVAAAAGEPVDLLAPMAQVTLEVPSLAAAVDALAAAGFHAILAVADGVEFPAGPIESALEVMESDIRVASVCFWSNAAGVLSLPNRNVPWLQAPLGFDATTLTAALRRTSPALSPVPVLYPVGGAVLLSGAALSAVGPLAEECSVDARFADFGLRARSRGLLNLLDPSTFLMRHPDTTGIGAGDLTPTDRAWLAHRHRIFGAMLEQEIDDPRSPLRIAHQRARILSAGLTVTVDGGSVGPLETGTQVQTLALVAALARHPAVRRVVLPLPGPVPGYAAPYLIDRAIDARPATPVTACAAGSDVVHRPFQPDSPIDLDALRGEERRVLITLQDLIAYRTGSYFVSERSWLEYRSSVTAAVGGADGVVVISDDVRQACRAEALPVSEERLFTVPNGTDHMPADAAERPPEALLDPALVGRPFVVVLGTTYAHKQRDLAVRALQLLRDGSYSVTGILVGAQVPVGSSRRDETLARRFDDGVIELPDVASEERTWLLRHAEMLLYPTAAEGFGLVPFEAARLGTPTVAVSFGPLREMGGTPPVSAESWAPEYLAAAMARLLADPALRTQQTAHVLAAGTPLTWDATAAGLVAAYQAVLALPPVGR